MIRFTMHINGQRRGGISLLEVLASIFVVSIGLLGILAVIPYGAFQMSKAHHAEYAANLLANAAEEIQVRNMIQGTPQVSSFVWFEPRGQKVATEHIFFASDDQWKEIMRGQDDIDDTSRRKKRPDASEEKSAVSSGKYTWFFTFRPPTDSKKKTAAVDVLACYNRVPGDDAFFSLPAGSFSVSRGGGTIALPDAQYMELLSQTKYVFVTWGEANQTEGGVWCKVVFLDKSMPESLKLIITGNVPNRNDLYLCIPSGVLYHKRLESVEI